MKVNRCITEKQIEQRIYEWHIDKDGVYRNMNIWDALGWTKEEYYEWVKDPSNIPDTF